MVDFTYFSQYENFGWFGMIMLFLYNVLYILSGIVELGLIIFKKKSF